MPNRIIKESICTSDTVAQMSDFEFRLWIGLIVQADDAGRGDARPAIIKGSVFPLRETVTSRQVEQALHGLATKGIVSLYNVGGKPYFVLPTWAAHQRIRDSRPKYPEPPTENDNPPQSSASCGELPQSSASCGLNPNPNPNPNTNTKNVCAKPLRDSAPISQTPIIELPLNDGSMFPVLQDFVDEMAKLYPSVDVQQQFNAMKGWLIGNPSRRKTRSGIKKFITAWLSREQNRGGRTISQQRMYDPASSKSSMSGNSSYDLESFERMTLYGDIGDVK